MSELEIITAQDLRSELFHVQTKLNEARAREKRYLWYMVLGGSPGALVTLLALSWGRGLLVGLVLLLLPLWYLGRWTTASRSAHELEQALASLEREQARLDAATPGRQD